MKTNLVFPVMNDDESRRPQCYVADGFVWLAGQTGANLGGELVDPNDPVAQTRQACENIRTLMELAGGTLEDVVRLTVYVVERTHSAACYSVIRSYFAEPLPCVTDYVVRGFCREDVQVVIDAWGCLSQSKRLLRTQDLALSGMPGVQGVTAEGYRVGNHVYLRGQTGIGQDGGLEGVGDPAAQAHQACENIAELMRAAGGTLADVVRVVYSVIDRADRLIAYPVINQTFPLPLPAGTGLVVDGLARANLRIAIDAWGFIDDSQSSKRLARVQDMTGMGMPGSVGQAAQCYRADNHVYLQGQTGFTLDGELGFAGDAAGQTGRACENIKELMELAGGTLANIVRIIAYVTDRAHLETVNLVMREYFRAPGPCRTEIVVKGLARAELVVEIDAWGFIDEATSD